MSVASHITIISLGVLVLGALVVSWTIATATALVSLRVLALPDPPQLKAIDELVFLLGRELEVRKADPQQLDRFIRGCMGRTADDT